MRIITFNDVDFFDFKDFCNKINSTDIGIIKDCAFGKINGCSGWINEKNMNLFIKCNNSSKFIRDEYEKEKDTGRFFNTAHNIKCTIEGADYFLEYLLKGSTRSRVFRNEKIIPISICWNNNLNKMTIINGTPTLSILKKLTLIGYEKTTYIRECKLFVDFDG